MPRGQGKVKRLLEGCVSETKARRLLFLCWLVYTAAYLGRLNFSACLVEIVSSLNTTRAAAGLVVSCFFFAYGAGQLVNGFLCKRYHPRRAVALALLASAALNLAMPWAGGIGVMQFLWLANGLAQSALWSTLIHTLGRRLPAALMRRAVLVMSTTAAVGTAAAYGMSALFVYAGAWRGAFYAAAVCMAAVAAVWLRGFSSAESGCAAEKNREDTARAAPKRRLRGTLLGELCVMLLLAVFTNFIKDGLTTWTPNILYELYDFPKSASIVLTLVLPLLAVSGAFFAVRLNRRLENHVSLCGAFFAVALVGAAALLACLRFGIWAVTLCGFGVTVCAMSAVNNVLTSMAPLARRDIADAGLLAGLINAFCYVGSTLSSVVLGSLADSRGWNGVFRLLLAMTGLALLVCFAAALLRRRTAPAADRAARCGRRNWK